ncbi:hypothetical protein [Nannocystis pusilla]|uniref:hypothetical protein n=1 Tax=Nannocystis pusilla TaxID=889268 RepID=UPI003B78E5AF
MQAPASRLLISAVSLAVVAACDPELAPRPETTAREASLLAAPGLDCLTDTKLRLHHDDGTLDVTTDLAAGLAELARPRDLVELSFVVTPSAPPTTAASPSPPTPPRASTSASTRFTRRPPSTSTPPASPATPTSCACACPTATTSSTSRSASRSRSSGTSSPTPPSRA